MSASAGLTITSKSNNRTAFINLIKDDSAVQTWNKASGLLDIGASSGVWRLGAAQDPGRLMALYAGPDYLYSNLTIVLEHVPSQFISAFCVSYAGSGSLVSNGSVSDDISWVLDVNPCM